MGKLDDDFSIDETTLVPDRRKNRTVAEVEVEATVEAEAEVEVAAPAEVTQPAVSETPGETLERQRQQTQRRLDAVIAGEAALRERTKAVNQLVAPVLKRIKDVEQKLNLKEPPLRTLRERAALESQQQAATLKSLSEGLAGEEQLRADLLEAGLRRYQNLQKTSVEPATAWSRTATEFQTSAPVMLAGLAERLSALERRWLAADDRSSAAVPPVSLDAVSDAEGAS